ncbi:peptidase, partial [Lactobacillus sp. UMNPBX5]
MKKIHILKTGTHTDSNGVSVSFTETDLQNSINAYNPAIHQAPIVIGHPKTDAPAFGWVKSLTADNGNLYAIPEQIQHDFGE